MGMKRKPLGDLVGPHHFNKSSLEFTKKIQDRWAEVHCSVCGVTYMKHGAVIAEIRRAGRKPICRGCYRKGQIEIAKAIVNTERRRNKCKGVAGKMIRKMRLGGKL